MENLNKLVNKELSKHYPELRLEVQPEQDYIAATPSEREEFVAQVIRHCPTATARDCRRLMKLAGTSNRMSKIEKELDERERSRLARVRLKLVGLCEEIGAEAFFGGRAHMTVKTDLADKVLEIPQI